MKHLYGIANEGPCWAHLECDKQKWDFFETCRKWSPGCVESVRGHERRHNHFFQHRQNPRTSQKSLICMEHRESLSGNVRCMFKVKSKNADSLQVAGLTLIEFMSLFARAKLVLKTSFWSKLEYRFSIWQRLWLRKFSWTQFATTQGCNEHFLAGAAGNVSSTSEKCFSRVDLSSLISVRGYLPCWEI